MKNAACAARRKTSLVLLACLLAAPAHASLPAATTDYGFATVRLPTPKQTFACQRVRQEAIRYRYTAADTLLALARTSDGFDLSARAMTDDFADIPGLFLKLGATPIMLSMKDDFTRKERDLNSRYLDKCGVELR